MRKELEREHTTKGLCEEPHKSSNYGLITTAKAEWERVVRGLECSEEEHRNHGRRIPKIPDLMDLPLSKEVDLKEEEECIAELVVTRMARS